MKCPVKLSWAQIKTRGKLLGLYFAMKTIILLVMWYSGLNYLDCAMDLLTRLRECDGSELIGKSIWEICEAEPWAVKPHSALFLIMVYTISDVVVGFLMFCDENNYNYHIKPVYFADGTPAMDSKGRPILNFVHNFA